MKTESYIGIDVCKDHLDVFVLPSRQSFRVSNKASEHKRLVTRFKKLAPTRLVLEATGGLEAALATALLDNGLPAVVVNPRRVRDFGLDHRLAGRRRCADQGAFARC